MAEIVLRQSRRELVASFRRRLHLGAEDLESGPTRAPLFRRPVVFARTGLQSVRMEDTASPSALPSGADPDMASSARLRAESVGVVVNRSASVPDLGGSQGPVFDDDGNEELCDLVDYGEEV